MSAFEAQGKAGVAGRGSDSFGDWTALVKYRLLSANEENGNYILSLFMGFSAPTGNDGNSEGHAMYTPTIAFGKGWGDFDFQSTVGVAFPDGGLDRLGMPLTYNTAFQYRIDKVVWPELEVNYTWYPDGEHAGKNQVYLTPGVVIGRLPLIGRLGATIGAGMQVAVSNIRALSQRMDSDGQDPVLIASICDSMRMDRRAVRLTALAIAIATALLMRSADAEQLTPLQVAYAGSMGSMMDRAMREAVAKSLGAELRGRAQGSTGLANLIIAGSIRPERLHRGHAGSDAHRAEGRQSGPSDSRRAHRDGNCLQSAQPFRAAVRACRSAGRESLVADSRNAWLAFRTHRSEY